MPIASAAEIERSISAPRPPAVAAPSSARYSGAQQLRLAAQALQPALARGELARALDALQTLLTALTDRDQLGLDLTAALDRQADGVIWGASGHGSVCLSKSGAPREGRK